MWSTRRSRWLAKSAWLGLLATCFSFSAGCAEEPYPDAITPPERKISEELFFIVCKRVAHDAYPNDVTGQRFSNVCDNRPEPNPAVMQVVAAAPRLEALINRRTRVIQAFDQAFGDVPLLDGHQFAPGELDKFLVDIVPFYDPPAETLPVASRALGKMLAELIAPVDENGNPRPEAGQAAASRSRGVLDTLARIAARKGYRRSDRTLGAVKPILTYPGIDELGQQLLGLVAEGGAGHEAFLATLRAAALELAEPREPDADPDNSTLHLTLDGLLLKEDKAFEEPGQEPLLVLKRDGNGDALRAPEVPPGAVLPTPFRVPGRADANAPRGANGEAAGYVYIDANKTPLAAGLREAKRIVERPFGGGRSTLENLSRGLRPLMGPDAPRTVPFNGKPFAFQGPDPARGPAFDLVHAIGAIAGYEETYDVLLLLKELIGNDTYQDAAASVVRMGLGIDATADDPRFDSAQLIGYDDTNKTPHEFWDDLLKEATRMTKRNGQIEALVKSFAQPDSALQGKLYATWMTYKDRITYNGAPMTLGNHMDVVTPGDWSRIPVDCEDCYGPDQVGPLNALITRSLTQQVDRSKPNYDVGMNRSIWQRTMSLINGLNGTRICNKKDGFLTVHGLLNAVDVEFGLHLPLIGGYEECKFIDVPDAVEIYSRAVLGTAEIKLLDVSTELLAFVGSVILGTSGDIQQRESQIEGFNATPTPKALARFIFAPRNKFLKDLLPETLTKEGLPIATYEPDALFPMEVALPAAGGKSFLDIGKPLLEAFETTELRTGMGSEARLVDGYMFANLLSTFHKHWSSRKGTPCPPTPTAGQEGCTQSLDPAAKLYSPQTNVVSYEPLLVEAFMKHDMTGVLQRAAAQVQNININGKDGLTILARFVQRMVTPDKELTYRNGRRFAATNTCAFPENAIEPPAQCDCPPGTTPADAMPNGACMTATGKKIPRGTIIADGVPPAYLVLDALKGIDKAFEQPVNQDRLAPWRQARSNLVDQFLTAVDDPRAQGKSILQNQRGRQIGAKAVQWFADRIKAHMDAKDLKSWAGGLGKRFEDTFGHPIVSGLLDVLDKGWENEGASYELARVSTYLMDPANRDAFAGLIVAVADTLTFVDRDKDLTPAIQFASLAVAPNAFEAFDTGAAPDVEHGVVSAALSLSNKVIGLDTDPQQLSTIGRILKNIVLPNAEQESTLDILFDVTADVNRTDPRMPTEAPFMAPDNRAVFNQMQSFMLDHDRGLERLWLVIQNRKRSVNITPSTPKAP